MDLIGRYRLREIGSSSEVYALSGGAGTIASKSPELHNAAFRQVGMDAVYLPFPSADVASFLEAAEAAGIRGAAVTFPHKEAIVPFLSESTAEVKSIGACNTISRGERGWNGHNTDALGFERDLQHFLGKERLEGMRVTLIGAGGAARAVASALSSLGASVLILNRTLSKARSLAKNYGFAFAFNEERSLDLVLDHAELIINATRDRKSTRLNSSH